jgi:hypothetical protein
VKQQSPSLLCLILTSFPPLRFPDFPPIGAGFPLVTDAASARRLDRPTVSDRASLLDELGLKLGFCNSMWALSRDDVVTRPRLDIHSKKLMFTIMCNPSGFYVVDRFPNDVKVNIDYFLMNILILLE